MFIAILLKFCFWSVRILQRSVRRRSLNDLSAATADALRHVFANGISQDRATPDFLCIVAHFLC
jgi:hypothetical protein